jgi:hypothetical protein
VAQSVEQLIRNQQVSGSIPLSSSNIIKRPTAAAICAAGFLMGESGSTG